MNRLLRRWQPVIHVLGGALALGLGLWGWRLHQPGHGIAGWVDSGFHTLQLLTFQFPRDAGAALPWQLNVARFLLPLVALFETYRLVLGAIRTPVRLALIGLRRGHVVVVGTGGVATTLLHGLLRTGRRTVAIAARPVAAQVQGLEAEGIAVLAGDPRQADTWHRAAADTAAAIFVMHASDLENLNVAVSVAAALREVPRAHPPLLVVRVEHPELAAAVDNALDPLRSAGSLRYRRLSIAGEAARALFLDPPLAAAKPDRAVPSHILILGCGAGAAAVLRQALVLAQDTPQDGPWITILAEPDAMAAEPLLADGAIPGFVATLRAIPATWRDGLPEELEAALEGAPPVNLACICRGDEAGVISAIALARRGLPCDCPIRVHQTREDRFLAALADASLSGAVFPRLAAFGGLLSHRAVLRLLDQHQDAMPRAIHAAYLAQLPPGEAGSHAVWDALAENGRQANRAAADHAAVKFALLGWTAQTPEPRLTPEQAAALARIEHRRWCAERLVRGFRLGPRDLARRRHPDLIPFDALSPDAQAKDHSSIAALPGLLRFVRD